MCRGQGGAPQGEDRGAAAADAVQVLMQRDDVDHRRLIILSISGVALIVALAITSALASLLFPADHQLGVELRNIAAAIIFIGSYLALAVGRIPGLSIDRAGIALVGAGLMIASGAQRALLGPETIAVISRLRLDHIPALSAVTAVLSNLVSNVPAVLLLKPFVQALPDRDTAWMTVAMASTLAGNFTVIGSVANLILVQNAAAAGVAIGFWDYFRVGAPLTLITLLIGTLWLWP